MRRILGSLLLLTFSAGCTGYVGAEATGLSSLRPIVARVGEPSGPESDHPGPRPAGSWLRSAAGDTDDRGMYRLASLEDELESERGEAAAIPASTRIGRRQGPLPGFWDTLKRDVKAMPGDLWADTKAVYTRPENLAILGLTYGGALAMQETGPDDTVERSFREGHSTFDKDWRDGFAAAGNPGTHFALAGLWYLVGQQTQDEKTYEVGKTLFSALIINGASTMAGQAASWDDAPNGEWGTFPSGHTSSSFAFASVMHNAYGHFVGVPLYALSGLVAYERLESNEHYLSDVVMGGVMGLVIGHTVSGEHEFELFGGRVVPYIDPYNQTSGLAWVKPIK